MRRPTVAAMRWQMFVRCACRGTARSTARPCRPFDEGLLRPVDHDVGDRVVFQQRLERPEAEHVVHQLAGQRALLAGVELKPPLGGDFRDQPLDVDGQPIFRHGGDRRRIEPRQADVAQFDDRLFRCTGQVHRRSGCLRLRCVAAAARPDGRDRRALARRPKDGIGAFILSAGTDSTSVWRPTLSRRSPRSAAESSKPTKATWRAISIDAGAEAAGCGHRRLAQRGGVADLARQVGDRNIDFHLQRFFDLPAGQPAGHADCGSAPRSRVAICSSPAGSASSRSVSRTAASVGSITSTR